MPSFGRIDGQKCEATQPPGARTATDILTYRAGSGSRRRDVIGPVTSLTPSDRLALPVNSQARLRPIRFSTAIGLRVRSGTIWQGDSFFVTRQNDARVPRPLIKSRKGGFNGFPEFHLGKGLLSRRFDRRPLRPTGRGQRVATLRAR
jgi:hypothetical protein